MRFFDNIMFSMEYFRFFYHIELLRKTKSSQRKNHKSFRKAIYRRSLNYFPAVLRLIFSYSHFVDY